MFFFILTIFILCPIIILYIYSSFKKTSPNVLSGKHVFITGGSKGIGLELAKLCLKNGAHVTIVARDETCLQRTKLDLIKLTSDSSQQNVLAYSVDVSEKTTFNIEKAIVDAEHYSGPIYLLACCAGTAIAKKFSDCSIEEFHKMMDINYFGTVNTIKASLPSLKKNKSDGRILIFSSLAGIIGLYGYSAYSASKFALIGLAEVLNMELRPWNLSITVSLPPDTDTPGFEIENRDKPLITKLISEEGGLFSPQTVADKSLKDCLAKEFISTTGMNGLILSTLCAGMMPTKSWIKRLLQVISMGLLRLIGLHFLYTCDKIIDKHYYSPKQKKSD